MHRGPVVEINLDNLRYNLDLVRKRVGQRPVLAVVKADAYGHGAVEISRVLTRHGVSVLAVAYISEAVELRESGINNPLIVLFDHDMSEEIVDYGLIPVVNDPGTARGLSSLALRRKREIGVHVNVDTGMGRLGLGSEGLKRELKRIASLKGIRITGLMSHFSDAELSDRAFALEQVGRFLQARDYLAALGVRPLCHIANSAAVMTLPESYLDAVRPGLLLYGSNPFDSTEAKPLMSVKTVLLAVRRVRKGGSVSYGRTFIARRDSLVGVLPVGYADGFGRAASNNAEVIVAGKRVPVIGRVCMDLTMVDLTDLGEGVGVSDEVVLVGSQGNETIGVDELATRMGTIPYEVLTALGNRNRRVYIGRRN